MERTSRIIQRHDRRRSGRARGAFDWRSIVPRTVQFVPGFALWKSPSKCSFEIVVFMSGTALFLPMRCTEPPSAVPETVFVSAETGATTWTIRADLVDELLPAVRRVLENDPALGPVETIKTGPHRTVYRLTVGETGYYLKHFRVADGKAVLQNLVRPAKAELEWRAAWDIARLGIATFEPVAVGRHVRGVPVGDSFLVTREIPKTVPLDRFVAENLFTCDNVHRGCDDALPRWRFGLVFGRIATAAGGCLGRVAGPAAWRRSRAHRSSCGKRAGPHWRLRSAGAVAHRLASGEFSKGAFGGPTVCQSFAFSSVFCRPIDSCRPAAILSRLPMRIAAIRFEGKCTHPKLPRSNDLPAEREEIAALERVLATAADRGWIRADRAWLRGNRHVRKRDDGPVACRGLATLAVSWLEAVRDDPEQLFRDNLVRWHKQTPRHRVAEVRLPKSANAPATGAFLKCIEERGIWRRWLARFRHSPVRHGWEIGHVLLRRGIDTPRPLLFVERPEADSRNLYLLTEAIPGSLSAAEFFAKCWPGLSRCKRSEWLGLHLARLARQLRRMHDAGFDHRDLKFSNLVVAGDLADPRIWFLDLDGVGVWRRLPARRATQNLARINVSARVNNVAGSTDRLRFLRWYLGDKFGGEWKWWWRRITRVSKAKIADNLRRKRPLS